MTNLIEGDPESILGISRDKYIHYGRAVSEKGTFYILHSDICLLSNEDLNECKHSKALDKGLDMLIWQDYEDVTVRVVLLPGVQQPLYPLYAVQENFDSDA